MYSVKKIFKTTVLLFLATITLFGNVVLATKNLENNEPEMTFSNDEISFELYDEPKIKLESNHIIDGSKKSIKNTTLEKNCTYSTNYFKSLLDDIKQISEKKKEKTTNKKKKTTIKEKKINSIIKKYGKETIKKKAESKEHDYRYKTDDQGRIEQFEAKNLVKNEDERLTSRCQTSTPWKKTNGYQPTDAYGHLIAHEFCGSYNIDNVVPMGGNSVNQSSYKNFFENRLFSDYKTKTIKENQSVKGKIEYEGNSKRPKNITVEYYYGNGNKIEKAQNEGEHCTCKIENEIGEKVTRKKDANNKDTENAQKIKEILSDDEKPQQFKEMIIKKLFEKNKKLDINLFNKIFNNQLYDKQKLFNEIINEALSDERLQLDESKSNEAPHNKLKKIIQNKFRFTNKEKTDYKTAIKNLRNKLLNELKNNKTSQNS